MSIAAMNYVDENVDPQMPSGMFFVLYRLANRASDHSREDWTCFPSVDTQQEDTHLSRSAVERHLSALVMDGWVSRKRRVRLDGKLGFYDYWIHRTPERRAALKEARRLIREAGDRPAETLADLDHPCSKTPCGPCGDLGSAMPQSDGPPCGNSPPQEHKGEPSGEPTPRAREPGDEGFEGAVALWPEIGRKFTRWPAARSAWAFACTIETAERLTAATKACAEDPVRAKGDHGWPGFDVFLRDEVWRGYLPKPAAPAPVVEARPRTEFAGPADLRAAVAAYAGESFAVSCLDRCTWDGEALSLTAHTEHDFAALRARVGHLISKHGASLGAPLGSS